MAARPASSVQSHERTHGLLIVGADFSGKRGRDPDGSLSETAYRRAFYAAAPSARTRTTPENSPTRCLLSAAEFALFVSRERDLADRGTRPFSLIALRKRGAVDDGLRRLALRLRERLRSTDLVGRLQKDRVEVLLSDTGPAGARIVCDWASDDATRHGIEVEATIYVYPTVAEGRSRDDDDDRDPRGGGPPGGRIDGHRFDGHTGRLISRSADITPNGASAGGVDPALRTPAHERKEWPMVDLWPEPTLPTPLWKRALDVTCASIGLLVLSPLLAAIALAVKLESPGPVIFRQQRAGRGGRAFTFYKFRSMCVDAEQRRAALETRNEQSGPVFKIHDDPRVTRIGRILRRWSLDELPQLWNIVKGDISLVGPRSPTFNEVEQYERWHRRRLNVTGGITCFWQVSGRSRIAFREWMRMDRWYVQRRCLALDLWLLLRTLPAVVSGRGAC
jgi:lipopolysaccharide/colanic/teichoic acid biosynthesis glycosyltransferase